jgi:hypothetical protein
VLMDVTPTTFRRNATACLDTGNATIGTTARLTLSARDQHIFALARAKLGARCVAFDEAVRALQAAVEESIPAGRVDMLGIARHGPIVGSLISGVGIVASDTGVHIVCVDRAGRSRYVSRFAP